MQDSYRELFLSESEEYLKIVSNCLVKLEENPADLDSLNEIFRCMHTLKGMSATMGFDKLTQISHQMENLLDELRGKRKKVTTEIIDMLFATLDILEQLVDEIKSKKESTIDIAPCLLDLKEVLEKGTVSMKPAGPSGDAQAAQEPPLEAISHLTADGLSPQEIARGREAQESGLNILRCVIIVSKECIMKEARAFLVVNNLNKMGEIIASSPALENVKAGKFDLSFELLFCTKETQENVRKQLLMISELDHVEVNRFDLSVEPSPSPEPITIHPLAEGQELQGVASQPAHAKLSSGGYAKKIQSMRIPVERLDKIMNLMGELAIARIRLMQVSQTSHSESLEDVSSVLDRLISSLQDEIMQTRLLPVSYILDTFPRMVRDLSKKQNKEINFEVIGSEIELDRVALDELSDPLVHLIRNAIDHGIEFPEERKARKKNPNGKLLIQVTRQKGQIVIEIIDDGRGVDFEVVKKAALGKGLISKEEAVGIDAKKILDLIALPGFSTARKVTDISGRGVGLDVVKSKIEALGGRLEFETKLGEGSKFILTLPLTLAIIKAMLVEVGEEIFAIPLMSVREIIKINEEELKMLQSFEVARVRDEIIPIIRLHKELDISLDTVKRKGIDDRLSVIIIEYGKKALGLVVSAVLGEQDIVVKPLGVMVKRTKGIAGATILGDGKVALILDTMSLR